MIKIQKKKNKIRKIKKTIKKMEEIDTNSSSKK